MGDQSQGQGHTDRPEPPEAQEQLAARLHGGKRDEAQGVVGKVSGGIDEQNEAARQPQACGSRHARPHDGAGSSVGKDVVDRANDLGRARLDR